MRATALLTAAAMAAFAANSLLARLALSAGGMDPALYTGVRLLAGAAVLGVLLRGRGSWPGGWAAAAALLAYALAFSLAYVRLGVAAGALVLFASVQATMLGWAVMQGRPPSRRAWLGMAVAFAGLVALLAPGLSQPDSRVDPGAATLMAVSGMAWGVYTLLGRGGGDPTGQTAGNFVRTAPAALLLVLLPLSGGAALEPRGLLLAAASGAVASGAGYALWYRALPGLSVVQASVVQLLVPAVAAVGAVLFVNEPLSLRLVLAGGTILAGVALAVVPAHLATGGRRSR